MGKKIAHQKRISKIKIKEVHFFCQRLKIFQTDWFLKNQNNDKVNNIYASKIKIIQCPGLFPVEVGTVPEMDLFDVVFQRVLRHKLLFAQRAFCHLWTFNTVIGAVLWTRIRNKLKGRIRIEATSWIHLEAWIRIRICIKVKGRIRIILKLGSGSESA